MKATKALFFELMYDFQSERWNEFELPKLSLRELLALAKLLGCPSCGSKEAVIVRLLAHRELRLKLARFADNPEDAQKTRHLARRCAITLCWDHAGLSHNEIAALFHMPSSNSVAQTIRRTKAHDAQNSESSKESNRS
jgi:hypothetical protein